MPNDTSTDIPSLTSLGSISEDQAWEYQALVFGHTVDMAVVNEQGQQGWELVSVVTTTGMQMFFYFKRRLK